MSIPYKIIILGDTKPYHIEKTGEDEIEIEYDKMKYRGTKAESFKTEVGFIDRFLFKEKEKHILVFYEYKQIGKQPKPEYITPVFPPNTALRKERDSDNRKFSFKSSNLLWRVMKYRGVKPAFKDEYKEPFNFPKIPAWAIIPVVLVILGVLIYILITSGSLEIIVKMLGGVEQT